LDTISKNDYLISGGDFNAQVGNGTVLDVYAMTKLQYGMKMIKRPILK
jgi:hypothetical protein